MSSNFSGLGPLSKFLSSKLPNRQLQLRDGARRTEHLDGQAGRWSPQVVLGVLRFGDLQITHIYSIVQLVYIFQCLIELFRIWSVLDSLGIFSFLVLTHSVLNMSIFLLMFSHYFRFVSWTIPVSKILSTRKNLAILWIMECARGHGGATSSDSWTNIRWGWKEISWIAQGKFVQHAG